MTTRTAARIPLHPNVRRSPYFDRTLAAGAVDFMVYNHTYMPIDYGRDPREDWDALVERVTLWDVGAERQTELRGPDALRLADYLSPRDLTGMAVGELPLLAGVRRRRRDHGRVHRPAAVGGRRLVLAQRRRSDAVGDRPRSLAGAGRRRHRAGRRAAAAAGARRRRGDGGCVAGNRYARRATAAHSCGSPGSTPSSRTPAGAARRATRSTRCPPNAPRSCGMRWSRRASRTASSSPGRTSSGPSSRRSRTRST